MLDEPLGQRGEVSGYAVRGHVVEPVRGHGEPGAAGDVDGEVGDHGGRAANQRAVARFVGRAARVAQRGSGLLQETPRGRVRVDAESQRLDPAGVHTTDQQLFLPGVAVQQRGEAGECERFVGGAGRRSA